MGADRQDLLHSAARQQDTNCGTQQPAVAGSSGAGLASQPAQASLLMPPGALQPVGSSTNDNLRLHLRTLPVLVDPVVGTGSSAVQSQGVMPKATDTSRHVVRLGCSTSMLCAVSAPA